MKLYRLFAFATALAIVLLLASAPSLMLRAEARHRQLTVTEQHVAVARYRWVTSCAHGAARSSNNVAGSGDFSW